MTIVTSSNLPLQTFYVLINLSINSFNWVEMDGQSGEMNWSKIHQEISISKKQSFRKIEFHEATRESTKFALSHVKIKNQREAVNNRSANSKVAVERSLFDSNLVEKYGKWTKISNIGPGLHNNGNTCFLNSVLQCLMHSPALAQVMIQEASLALKNIDSNRENPNSVCSMFQRFDDFSVL